MKNKTLSFNSSVMIWLIIAASFSINLPIAFGSIYISLFLILWLASGDYAIKLTLIKNNPGAIVALLLFCAYAIGTTYSSASIHDSTHYLMKYSKLLLIPLIVAVVTDEKYRKYAINAFLISLLGYLLVSYLNWLGIFSLGVMRHGTYMSTDYT